MIRVDAWYSIAVTGFWAAWTGDRPTGNPWRRAAATGHPSRSRLDAETAVRRTYGYSAALVELPAGFAEAAAREMKGRAPAFTRKGPPRKPIAKTPPASAGVPSYVSVLHMRGGFWWAAWLVQPVAEPWTRADATASTPAQTIDAARSAADAALAALRAERGLPLGGRIVRLAYGWAAAESRAAKGKAPAFWDTSAAAKRARQQEDEERSARTAREAGYASWDEYSRSGLDEVARKHGYASWAAWIAATQEELRAFCGSGDASSADLAALQLTPPVTPEAVQRAYRRLVVAEKLHPDLGGDASAFIRVTAARDRLLAAVPA